MFKRLTEGIDFDEGSLIEADDRWKLKGVVTHHANGSKPDFVADLGESFNSIEPRLLQ